MADISKITLPSGNTYDIKDATARELIAGGITFVIAWDGESTPSLSDLPAGVQVEYHGVTFTGTKAASSADPGSFYLVKSGTSPNAYDEYVAATVDSSKVWERLGGKDIDLSNLGALAYKDTVTVNTGSGDVVLGEATTFTNSTSAVTFSGGTTDKVLGSDATFTTSLLPSMKTLSATASGTTVGANGTDTFVKSYPGTTQKLYKETFSTVDDIQYDTIPAVGSVGTASTWSFAMGSGNNAETLIISGANSTTPTITAHPEVVTSVTTASATVVTGLSDMTYPGNDVVLTGLGTATTASALTGVQVTAQPTVALNLSISPASSGKVSLPVDYDATTTVNSKDEVTAVTSIGTGTAAAQTITVGTNDKVTVAKKADISASVS